MKPPPRARDSVGTATPRPSPGRGRRGLWAGPLLLAIALPAAAADPATDLAAPEAVDAFDRAIALKPESPNTLYHRGLAHLGRKTEARDAISRSVEADPSSRPRADQAIVRFGL